MRIGSSESEYGMIAKLKSVSKAAGLIFCIVSALICMAASWMFFEDGDIYMGMRDYLFDCGIDAMGALTCAALFYGCMRQEGEGTGIFRTLVVLVSSSFLVNLVMYYTMGVVKESDIIFVPVIISKLIDTVLIYFFYRYVSETLGFEGTLKRWAEKGFPILMGIEIVLVLVNLFYPLIFAIDESGRYQGMPVSIVEDLYLLVMSVITMVLIVRSDSSRNQKVAALTFVILPLVMYVMEEGEFGNASQYGMVLMSLVIMYCIIFNDKNTKLAATQTELNMATGIQESMLPSVFPAFPDRSEFDIYATMDPAKEVGGDFYDFYMIDDDHLGIVVADVSGKGIPAALFMMISKTIIQNFAMLGIGAAELLNKANDALCAQNKMEMFVTAWVGILELSTGRMTCSSAGHEYPAIYHDGKFELLKDKHGLVLGGMEGARYKDYEIQLEKGDKLFQYTDGIPEATNEDLELFGTDRMVTAFNTDAQAKPKDLLRVVRAAIDRFVGGAEQFDDMTMVCIEYKGPNAA